MIYLMVDFKIQIMCFLKFDVTTLNKSACLANIRDYVTKNIVFSRWSMKSEDCL